VKRMGEADAEPTRTNGYIGNGGFRIRFTYPTVQYCCWW